MLNTHIQVTILLNEPTGQGKMLGISTFKEFQGDLLKKTQEKYITT